VKHRYLVLTFAAIISSVFILFSCRKINDATELGGGLIPAVDNVTTFDTTITVEAYNDIFTNLTDSLRITRSEEHFLGIIDNAHKDPLFGTTDARLFLELKPSFYKFAFENSRPDSLRIDSVVIVLDYVETYGDTNVLQTVNVYELDQANDFKVDSAYKIRENNFTTSALLGTRTFAPSILNDSVKAFRDTTKNQLRIKLNAVDFGRRLLDYDSTIGANGAYYSDSAFRTKFKGFALQATSGKAVMGFNLGGANTKLAIYYHYDKKPVMDTATVTYFNFTSLSASANYIQRDYTGSAIAAYQGGTAPDPFVFLQNTPGSFATIKIPDLKLLNNRLIHRAELIVEEVYDGSDTVFSEPTYLYLDAYDTAISKYRTIPYDLTFDVSGSINTESFGMSPKNQLDASGKNIKVWKFNISRYVQNYLTRTQPLHDLRLSTPFYINNEYSVPPSTATSTRFFIINPSIVKGRVRVAGGTAGPQRMRLRLVYSKL
jgi:hypothetical protein